MTATEHLHPVPAKPFDPPQPDAFAVKPKQRRPRVFRVALHSEDRILGSATNATFQIGDLVDQWGLADDNVDAGNTHFNCVVQSFHLSASTATPAILEILAENWNTMPETFDSSLSGSSKLLGVAVGATSASCDNGGAGFTLKALPRGRMGIRLVTRDAGDLQAALDADASVRWHLVIAFVPWDV